MTSATLSTEPLVFPSVLERLPAPDGRPLTYAIDTGRIIVAVNQAQIEATVRRWVRMGPQPLAHDLECAASNAALNGTGLHPHLGLIRLAQFAVLDGGHGYPEALVFDLWKFSAASLMALLADPAWPTLVHFAPMEQRFWGWTFGLAITNLIDTHHVSQLIYTEEIDPNEESGAYGKPRHNLAIVNRRNIGYDMDKTQQNSAWGAIVLTNDQLVYAGLDVLSLLDLWRVMEQQTTPEMRQSMASKAQERIDKVCAPCNGGDADADGQPTPFNEADRAVSMIQAARNLTELREITRDALPHLRIHFHERPRVMEEAALAHERLRLRQRPPVRKLVAPTSWEMPF